MHSHPNNEGMPPTMNTDTARAQTMMRLHTVPPEWLSSHFDGRRVIGWHLMTEPREDIAVPVGYRIIEEGVIVETRMDGVGMRSTMLNMYTTETGDTEQ
jgi:hypothetical protein